MPSALPALVNLVQDFIPAGRPNRPGTRIRVRSITVHHTSNANPGADARAHARFIKNSGHYVLPNGQKNWVSWHFTVDDRIAIQHLPVHEKAFHAGAANLQSLGVEICMYKGIDQAAAHVRAATLIAALLKDLGLGISAVKTHRSWTGKACPTLLLNGGKEGARWAAFLQGVEGVLKNLNARQAAVLEAPSARMAREPAPPAAARAGAGRRAAAAAPEAEHDHVHIEIPARFLSKPKAAPAPAVSPAARPAPARRPAKPAKAR